MPLPPPSPLSENAGLFFRGERSDPAAALTAAAAQRLLGARNLHGKSNADVLRRRLTGRDGRPVETWQIDFPPHFTPQEAALYAAPYAHWQKHSPPRAGLNPAANPDLRRALARVSRWLATPVAAAGPDWQWIEEDLLPDATLLVVARDDDFTHGVLQSRVFALWWSAFHSRRTPTLALESFPFPWPPATGLSALTKAQEEHRHAVARAARGGDTDALHAAVAAAYGWPADLPDDELLARLHTLHRARAG